MISTNSLANIRNRKIQRKIQNSVSRHIGRQDTLHVTLDKDLYEKATDGHKRPLKPQQKNKSKTKVRKFIFDPQNDDSQQQLFEGSVYHSR